MLSGQTTITNNRCQTHLICILTSTNLILMLKINHYEFHPGILTYNLLLGQYNFLPESPNLLHANVRTER